MFNSRERNIVSIFFMQLKAKKYYEAHETIEKIWFPLRFDKNNIKVKILKGLINSAVSLRLIQLNRLKQSKKPFNTFLKYSKLVKKEDKYICFINKFIIKKYTKELKRKK